MTNITFTNVLIISEEDVVHGQTVTDMLAKISIDDYTIEKILFS